MSVLTWAVAAVVTDQAGRVLLCRRSGPGRRWALPGGRLRRDETPLAAVPREIRAETGWTVELVDLVGLYRLGGSAVPRPPAGRGPALPDVLVHVFRARVRGDAPDAAPTAGCEPGWHAPDALPEALTPITRAALADALSGRSGVLREARPEPVTPGPRAEPPAHLPAAATPGPGPSATGTSAAPARPSRHP